ncbi:MAG: M36 family metallopeptidase, partial [Myxococcales bacterium]|nr:M36 family metallopeptidase [Myxococcales bacterium]
ALEVADAGTARVLQVTPRFPVPGHATDPAVVAKAFLVAHHDAFQLDAADASQFVVAGVDRDTAGDVRHVTLQRTYLGIPVFQGVVTVHMDGGNNVFRVLADESYRIDPPRNRTILDAADAARAAARALGLQIAPAVVETAEHKAVFTAPGLLEPIHVAQKIFHAGPGDDRFAYQVTLAWSDEQKQQQYELALVDAADGALLTSHSLVNSFSGLVFRKNPTTGANPPTDTRIRVSFDGDPVASPQGWVDSTRRTRGNNVIAATDLDRNNVVGTNEVQPPADANGNFDFPIFDSANPPLNNPLQYRPAAVVNGFWMSNTWHDRAYLLGFTETARNFQTSNFGRGGAQNDEMQVDVQDAAGVNNANFATPPDGLRPRMQMFLFTLNGGVQEDGALDQSVVYHEATHGLSNRLVGGGTTGCLGGIQSGGMGEGWSDWVAASFLNDPVIGAYVTGNATVGIRRASMANSPFTYGNIKDGTSTQVHAAGEIWAATLWDVRTALGAAVTEQLVVSGMKLTPCSPTMLQARDAILSADQQINGGANRCPIFRAFAGRLMGTGASSPNHNSTTAIVTSTAVPAGC